MAAKADWSYIEAREAAMRRFQPGGGGRCGGRWAAGKQAALGTRVAMKADCSKGWYRIEAAQTGLTVHSVIALLGGPAAAASRSPSALTWSGARAYRSNGTFENPGLHAGVIPAVPGPLKVRGRRKPAQA
jgi:hypothetical protein